MEGPKAILPVLGTAVSAFSRRSAGGCSQNGNQREVHGHWMLGPSVLWKPFLAKCVCKKPKKRGRLGRWEGQ